MIEERIYKVGDLTEGSAIEVPKNNKIIFTSKISDIEKISYENGFIEIILKTSLCTVSGIEREQSLGHEGDE